MLPLNRVVDETYSVYFNLTMPPRRCGSAIMESTGPAEPTAVAEHVADATALAAGEPEPEGSMPVVPTAEEAVPRAEALCAQLRASSSTERSAAYVALGRLELDARAAGGAVSQQEAADIAVACTAPLCEILCRDAAEVGAEELRRAALALTALTDIDAARVGGEAFRPGQSNIWCAWSAETSALGAILAKDPADLVLEDALTIGCTFAAFIGGWATSRSIDAIAEVAGVTAMEFLREFNANCFLCVPCTNCFRTADDARNYALAPLMVELLKEPEKLPPFALVGCLCQLECLNAGRPKVALKCLEHGIVDAAMGVLGRATPAEQVTTTGFARGGHGEVYHMMFDLVGPAQIGGEDLTGELLACGFIDQFVAMLNAVEELGASNVCGDVIFFGLWFLKLLDGEALPQIEEKLRAAKPALRYLCDSPITSVAEIGWTCGVFSVFIAANLFGRDEGNTFGFVQKDIDGVVEFEFEMLRASTWGKIWQLVLNQCKGLLSLCISDSAKKMLLEHAGFIPLLIDGLLLDDEHPRKDTAEAIKERVQHDYAECIQQISLFPPGRAALQAAGPRVVEALDMLVDKAWSDEAKQCAHAALMQLCPERIKHSEQSSDGNGTQADGGGGHVMISYQWVGAA